MAAIHDRMPVILPSNSFDKWLDLDARLDDLAEVLRPCSPEILEAYTVSSVVNNPKFDSPACIARV
jgi:putative SOS response-associated peptidase YedK